MTDGNWVPIDKRLADSLPKDRPYTELEAYYSVALDADAVPTKLVSVTGYAKLWKWSWRRVKQFLDRLDLEIQSDAPRQPGILVRKTHDRTDVTTDAQQATHIKFWNFGRLSEPKNNESHKECHNGGHKEGQTTKDTETKKTETETKKHNISDSFSQKSGQSKSTTIDRFTQEVIDLYHEMLPDHPSVKPKEKAGIEADIRTIQGSGSAMNNLPVWRQYFRFVGMTPYLSGENADNRKADLVWLVSADGFRQTMEKNKHWVRLYRKIEKFCKGDKETLERLLTALSEHVDGEKTITLDDIPRMSPSTAEQFMSRLDYFKEWGLPSPPPDEPIFNPDDDIPF